MSASNGAAIQVMLVDDQRLIRDGLRYIIDTQPDMRVSGEAENGLAAFELALATKPDVILMDIQMPGGDGLTATSKILAALPDTKILLLTTFDVVDYVYDGIRAGAVGYLLKDADAMDLLDSIRAVCRGEALYRTPAASEALSKALKAAPSDAPASLRKTQAMEDARIEQPEDVAPFEELTGRELEVLQEMAWGLRNDEIAAKLSISEGTVKTHVHRILQKFGVDDRTQAVVFALRRGMVR
ncbi:response regulator [Alicyclobacillus acidiphilus]|uniref:response regulator n=1 Tax=Alicyclobacillus acidiphilus TaxID=182455 RepID=UPI00083292F6|nr:response regulator transcription factor [Alicyclobacillus acidiphilus]